MDFGLRGRLAANKENVILDGEVLGRLRRGIEDLFEVTDVTVPRQAQQGVIVFTGRLLMKDADRAYDLLAERWTHQDYTPILRKHGGEIQLIAQPGLVKPRPANPWINLGLFVVTVLSVLFIGAMNEGARPFATQPVFPKGYPSPSPYWRSWVPTSSAIILPHVATR
jgi:hypothetical protein